MSSDNPENEVVIINQMHTISQLQNKLQALNSGMGNVKKELEAAIVTNDWSKAIDALNKGSDIKNLLDTKSDPFPDVSFDDIAKELDDWSTQLFDEVKIIIGQTTKDVKDMLKSRLGSMTSDVGSKFGSSVDVSKKIEV